MANPRRMSLHLQPQPSPDSTPPPPSSVALSSLPLFLKRPSAFPFLLSLFLLLTWLFLRFQHPTAASRPRSSLYYASRSEVRLSRGGGGDGRDLEANLVRFSALEYPTPIAKDGRGWLLDPVVAALQAGIRGGALACTSVHVGQIQPGGLRGNHRHHTCNETFVIWGAETKFRLENSNVKDKGYGEVTIRSNEVAIAASPRGTAHALINVDNRPTFFLGCQDNIITNASTSDYKVWKDL